MTDTPAESAEDPRTPEEWTAQLYYFDCPGEPHGNRISMFDQLPRIDCQKCVEDAIRAALAARDARVLAKLEGWRREHRYEGPFNPEDIYEELRALLSEGKP